MAIDWLSEEVGFCRNGASWGLKAQISSCLSTAIPASSPCMHSLASHAQHRKVGKDFALSFLLALSCAARCPPLLQWIGGAFTSALAPGAWTTFGEALFAPVDRIHWWVLGLCPCGGA